METSNSSEPDYDLEQWNRVFQGRGCQVEFVVETGIRLGSRGDAYLPFEGNVIRWVNPTRELCAVVILPSDVVVPTEQQSSLILRFLTNLTWKTGFPAYLTISGGYSMRRQKPLHKQPRVDIIAAFDPNYLTFNSTDSDRMSLARSLYSEAVNIGYSSPFSAFLSYYKVFEVAFDLPTDRTLWINTNAPALDTTGLVAEIQSHGGNVEGELYNNYRCAIAHAKNNPVANPANFRDWLRVRRALPLVQALAKRALQEKAGRLSLP